MLLRRFLDNFRRQDWIAIALDFVIVVVGIFVGLQADQWNQSRKDRIVEAQYVESLKSDLLADIGELDAAIDLARNRARLGRLIHTSIRKGSVDSEPNEFIWAVYNSLLLNYPSYTRATTDELLSTGNLRLLRDQELKSDIAAYYTEIERLEQWTPTWRDMQVAMEHTLPDLLDFDVREAGLLRYNGGPEWITRRFSFDQMDAEGILQRIVDHPTAKGQIENMTRIQDTHYLNLLEIKASAVALVESL